MIEPIIAVDCDLHRISAWCSTCGAVCNQVANVDPLIHHVRQHERLSPIRLAETPLTIFEIAAASSVVGSRVAGTAKLHHLARWMLYNVHIASKLAGFFGPETFHVAPSSVWTRGHNEAVRQKMAGVQTKHAGTKKPIGHDLRECQAMLWFHQHNPEKWVSLPLFMERL